MKLNTLFLLLISTGLCQFNMVLGQNALSEERIIYLNDGSVLIGTTLEEDLNRIVLVVSTGDTLHIDKSLIRTRLKKIKATKFHYTKGIFASIDLNLLAVYNSNQIDLILGYRLNEKYALGIGVGAHTNSSNFNGIWPGNTFNPIYAYGRRYFALKMKNKPFIFMKAGYGFTRSPDFGWSNTQIKNDGGLYAQPGIGLNFASRNKFRIIMSLSQYFQYSSGEQHSFDAFNNPVEVNYSGIHSEFTFKIGIEFR